MIYRCLFLFLSLFYCFQGLANPLEASPSVQTCPLNDFASSIKHQCPGFFEESKVTRFFQKIKQVNLFAKDTDKNKEIYYLLHSPGLDLSMACELYKDNELFYSSQDDGSLCGKELNKIFSQYSGSGSGFSFSEVSRKESQMKYTIMKTANKNICARGTLQYGCRLCGGKSDFHANRLEAIKKECVQYGESASK